MLETLRLKPAGNQVNFDCVYIAAIYRSRK